MRSTTLQVITEQYTDTMRKLASVKDTNLYDTLNERLSVVKRELDNDAKLMILKLQNDRKYHMKLQKLARIMSYVNNRIFYYSIKDADCERTYYYKEKQDWQGFQGKTKAERKRFRTGNK